ncbi:MAG: hypothetical protein AAF899_09945 [Pseudomonadota bacterium]
MFHDLAILRQAGELGRHAAARQRLAVENIAQASTPGYRARDLTPFSMEAAGAESMRRTRAGHVGGASVTPARIVIDESSRAPNGNGVSLEAESLRAVRIEGQHRLAVAVYAKAQSLIRLSTGRQR